MMNTSVKNYMVEKEFYKAIILKSSSSIFSELHTVTDKLADRVNFTTIQTEDLSGSFAPLYLQILDNQADIMIICYDDSHDDIIEFISNLKKEEELLPVLIISSQAEVDVASELMKYPNVDYLSLQGFNEMKFFRSLTHFRKEHKYHYLIDLLRAENKKLWQIIKQNPVSILISEAKSNTIEFVNYNFTQLTGFTLYEVLGKNPKVLSSEKTNKDLYKFMWETLNIGKVWKGEIQNKKKDGSYFWSYTAIAPLYNDKSELTHYVAIYDDITDNKIAEQRLQEYTSELQRKSQQLEQMNEQLNHNMKKALLLHRHFFPKSMPIVQNYELEAYYQPADIIGGDFYNVVHYKKQLLFYIVDVSGKGIDGAFINIFVRQKINRFLYIEKEGKGRLCPKEILQFLAQEYNKEKFPDEYFICLFVGVLNLEDHTLEYGNAGIQIPPIIAGQSDLITLNVGGLPISSAIDVDLLTYEKERIAFPAESSLVITSDGMIEEYENDEIYGIDRFNDVVKRYFYLPPMHLKEKLVSEIKKFLNGKGNEDDHTFLILQSKFEKTYTASFVLESSIEEIQLFGDDISNVLKDFMVPNYDLVVFGIFEMGFNALEHGNKFDKDKKIKIKLDVFKNHMKLSIEDEGDGFHWREKINRKINILNANERGRGIILTKKCFDSIHYNEKGNKVTLYAHFNK